MLYDTLFEHANKLYEAGALHEAESLYRRILEVSPNQPEVLNMLGLIAQIRGQHDVAVDYFFRAVEQRGDNWAFVFNLAVSQAYLGQYTSAVRSYERVLKACPNLKEALYNLGGVYESLHQTDLAKSFYRQASDQDPSYVAPRVRLAYLSADLQMLKDLCRTFPSEAEPAYYLALTAWNEHQDEVAEEAILNALKIDNNSPEINILYGKIKLKNKEMETALKAFQRALSEDPKNLEALLQTAVLTGEEELFLRALDLSPNSAEAHTAYADMLRNQKRTVEALEEYRRAVIADPDSVAVSNNLALILKDEGSYEQALDLFFNAFLKAPEISEISQNIAQTLILLHDDKPEEAHQIALKWQKTASENPWAKHILASFEGRTPDDETDFNVGLFDSFAPTYETVMEKIKYNVLNEVSCLNICFNGKILDAGCGTGLLGKQIKNASNSLTGVDFSERMLNLAKEKGVYDRLVHAELKDFLKAEKPVYDLIFALDVFNYFSDPTDVILLMNKIPLVLTIEKTVIEAENGKIMPNGRYRHQPNLLAKKLESFGYRVQQKDIILRSENGVPVEGVLFYAF